MKVNKFLCMNIRITLVNNRSSKKEPTSQLNLEIFRTRFLVSKFQKAWLQLLVGIKVGNMVSQICTDHIKFQLLNKLAFQMIVQYLSMSKRQPRKILWLYSTKLTLKAEQWHLKLEINYVLISITCNSLIKPKVCE